MNSKRTNVLLVEDDPADEQLMRSMLIRAGDVSFESEWTDRLSSALKRIAAGGIDVVLLDLTLPDSTGLNTFLALHACAPKVPIIVLAGTNDDELATRAVREGAQDYLIKGQVNGSLLVRAMRYAIERQRADAQIRHLNQFLRALRDISQLLTRKQNPAQLLQRACEILMQTREYPVVWVGLIKAGYKHVVPGARAGRDLAAVDRLIAEWGDSEAGQGVTRTVIRTHQAVILRHGADDPRFQAWQRAALTLGYAASVAIPLLHADRLFGVLHVYATSADTFDDEELAVLAELANDLAFALQSIEDEIARKRAEEDLHANARRFRALIENSTDAVALLRADATVMYLSPSSGRMLGRVNDQLIGRQPFELLHPDDRECAMSKFYALTGQPGELVSGQYRLLHTDGSWHWIESVAKNLLAEPSVQAVVVNFRDITERKQRERELEAVANIATALRAALTRADMLPIILNQLIDSPTADGAALHRLDVKTGESVIELALGEWAGAAGVRLAPGTGIVGRVITTRQPYITHDARSDLCLAQVDLLGNMNAVACVPLIAQEQAIGALAIGSQTDFTGDEVRLLSSIADIASSAIYRADLYEQTQLHASELEQRVAERTRELIEANRQLKELDRLKDQFVSNINYELRAPLANIKLYLNLLEHGRSEKRDQYMQTLNRETVRLETLIEDLLELSRLDLGHVTIRLGAVDLNHLTTDLIVDGSPLAADRGLVIDCEPDPEVPLAQADPVMLYQVMFNLMTNAINYTPRGGIITCTTRSGEIEGQDWVTFTVTDTGPGISPEDRSQLFKRFFRGEAGRRYGAPGAGLGLAISKEIVERMNGRITLDSEPGHGAAFTVWLRPASSEQQAQS